MQSLTTKCTIVGIAVLIFFLVVLRFHDSIAIDEFRDYTTSEAVVAVQTNNVKAQPGYFKAQPEWDWKVSQHANSHKASARKPRNKDVVILTASDGGGHNSAIPNILERVLDDRAKYCERHGYTNLWLNTSRYDIGEAHRTWSKIPAVAEAFHLYPNAEWVWLLDTDIILMTPATSLVSSILSPSAIEHGIMRGAPILDHQLKKNPTRIKTPGEYRVEDIDVLITQDHTSLNTGSTFFRRSAFTRLLLEMMTDYTMMMGKEHSAAEQDALKHLMLEHELVRKHVGIFPQRKFNAYMSGGSNMGYRDGDLLVHFAGCWTIGKCSEYFEEFWGKKDNQDVWRPEDD
ncbi:glycosyltransferase family 34 protein [Stemphylium lycopersici]|nr:glycosyltransferase family 34 protein [Stemphylium lycopersici]RAR07525.1 glycosyltransferase family 34 protein [Stemphylium lycopersici]